MGLDFSGAMLERARRKDPSVEWVRGDVLELPFADESFDAATVGFGVRNVGGSRRRAPRAPACAAAGRAPRHPRDHAVRAACSRPSTGLWFDRVIPLLGRLLPGGSAYTYLPASVRRFPAPDELAALLRGAGFDAVRYRLFAGGIVALHVGEAA